MKKYLIPLRLLKITSKCLIIVSISQSFIACGLDNENIELEESLINQDENEEIEILTPTTVEEPNIIEDSEEELVPEISFPEVNDEIISEPEITTEEIEPNEEATDNSQITNDEIATNENIVVDSPQITNEEVIEESQITNEIEVNEELTEEEDVEIVNEIVTIEETIEPQEIDDNNNSPEAEALLILVNEIRLSEGLNEVILNNELNDAAFGHSNDMFLNDYFAHEGLDGSNFVDRIREAGYTANPWSENIAKGFRDAQSVFNGWIGSEGHRNNILNPNATEMGIGVSGTLWTQVFGRRR